MRHLLLILSFTLTCQAETVEEAYKRLFPHGAYVLQIRPAVENSNRIILKPVRLQNQWAIDIFSTYIFYEVYLARQAMGQLTITAQWEGREYAAFGSRVFLSEKKGSEFYVKYILSSDLHLLSKRNMDFLAIAKTIRVSPEHLVPALKRCEGAF